MKNWSVDATKFKKNSAEYHIFRLNQLINFGLDGEKLSASQLRKYWTKLSIDQKKKNYLAHILWGEQYLLTNKKTS